MSYIMESYFWDTNPNIFRIIKIQSSYINKNTGKYLPTLTLIKLTRGGLNASILR